MIATPRDSSTRSVSDVRRRIEYALSITAKIGVCLVLLCGVLVYADSNIIDCRKNGNETAAIGALKTIGAAQALFREGDKDANKRLDYANSLEKLGSAGSTGLIDPVLASGLKQGYQFEVRRSLTQPEFRWIAYAWPMDNKGDRLFVTNHEGTTYYRSVNDALRFEVVTIDGDSCEIPAGWRPVGR